MSTTRYEITHVSRYVYSTPVRGCVMSLCLEPSDDPPQRLMEFDIATTPLSSMNGETDCFGNTRHVINIHREHGALEIVARSEIEDRGDLLETYLAINRDLRRSRNSPRSPAARAALPDTPASSARYSPST